MEMQTILLCAVEKLQELMETENQIKMAQCLNRTMDQTQRECLNEEDNLRQSKLKKLCTLLGWSKYKMLQKKYDEMPLEEIKMLAKEL